MLDGISCIGCFNISKSNGFTKFYPDDGYATLEMEGARDEWDMGKIYFCPVCGRRLTDLALIVRANSEEITKRVKSIFNSARFEFFEAGMDNIFHRELTPLLGSNEVVAAIASVIDEDSYATVSEVLKVIGYVNYSVTHDSRLALLLKELKSHSFEVRDGAGIGLDSLGDLAAIPALREAIECEPIKWMRQNLELVIRGLEM